MFLIKWLLESKNWIAKVVHITQIPSAPITTMLVSLFSHCTVSNHLTKQVWEQVGLSQELNTNIKLNLDYVLVAVLWVFGGCLKIVWKVSGMCLEAF